MSICKDKECKSCEYLLKHISLLNSIIEEKNKIIKHYTKQTNYIIDYEQNILCNKPITDVYNVLIKKFKI